MCHQTYRIGVCIFETSQLTPEIFDMRADIRMGTARSMWIGAYSNLFEAMMVI